MAVVAEYSLQVCTHAFLAGDEHKKYRKADGLAFQDCDVLCLQGEAGAGL